MSRSWPQGEPPEHAMPYQAPATVQTSPPVSSPVIVLWASSPPVPTGNSEEPPNIGGLSKDHLSIAGCSWRWTFCIKPTSLNNPLGLSHVVEQLLRFSQGLLLGAGISLRVGYPMTRVLTGEVTDLLLKIVNLIYLSNDTK